MATGKIDIAAVNVLDLEQFVGRFTNVIYYVSPVIAATAWSTRPFGSIEDIWKAFCGILDHLPPHSQEDVLRCYPDLATKLAKAGGLTRESNEEQKAAGLLELASDEQQYMSTMNDRYKAKFNFPFVICVRENKVQTILNELGRRLDNDPEQEVAVGVGEVKKIAHLRVCDLVEAGRVASKL